MHARLAKIARTASPDLIHAHQLEFPVRDFRRRLGRDLPVVLHAHAVRSFDEKWSHACIFGHNPGLHEFADKILARASVPKNRASERIRREIMA